MSREEEENEDEAMPSQMANSFIQVTAYKVFCFAFQKKVD
jgi:hypothetical protein